MVHTIISQRCNGLQIDIEQSNRLVVECPTIRFSDIGIDMSLAMQHSHNQELAK